MNRLAKETSPYLLQHAHNPVDWYPWSEEAFTKARAEDKPVFLSIGYSACHWCHVMERESFEDAEVAAILNEHFVSIKVDREERPDVDSIYMQAVQMMTGHGGWPMSMFLTPDGRPFYAGTYFPPESRYGMPSFRQVILQLAEAYRSRRGDVETAGNEIRGALSTAPEAQHAEVDRAALDRAASRVIKGYDEVNGGFGGAPKFPPSMTLDFLMQVAWRAPGWASRAPLREVIVHTLSKMANGGMYDQVGGGFHRYSTDAQWLVPHFEKMLYDNALLARLYTRTWQWTREPFFARIANEILGFVTREMTSPEGAFYSTLDADSEGEEGKFYVWSRAEVMSILGDEDGKIFCELFDVTEHGNWEGKNILHVAGDVEAHRELVLRAKCKLYGARAERVRPGRDEKVLSGWNGWMLAAFAEGCLAFGRYDDVVRKNADFLLTRIDANGHLIRLAKINGLLEDYAGVAWGLTLAHEAVNEPRYLDAARLLADQILERFPDETNGGFFDTPVDHEQLITRPKDLFDNATPGGNSVAVEVLLRVGCGSQPHQGPAESRPLHNYAEIARKTVESILPLAERYPSGFGFLLGDAEWLAGSPKEIHLTGGDVSAFRKVVGETYLPHRTIAYGEGEQPSAFVCENFVCLAPTDDPERLRDQLLAIRFP